MKDWLRFAIAYWHSFGGDGADPFGAATHIFPWNSTNDPLENAKNKADAAFEFITKTGAPYYQELFENIFSDIVLAKSTSSH